MSGPDRDRGFTLVELIVYMALLGIVLTIATTLLLNATRTQSTVQGASVATSTGQLVLTSVKTAVRNSTGLQISDNGKLLIARVPDGDSWVCQAWYYDASKGGSVYTTTKASRSAINTASAGSDWTLLARKAGHGLSSIFAPITTDAPTGAAVTVNLNMDTSGQEAIALTTTTVPRLFSPEHGTCF